MSANVENCTKLEMRAVIKFLTAEGIKPIEIHRRMTKVYREKCVSLRAVYEWVERFKNGINELEDATRPGQAKRVITPETISTVERLIRDNRQISLKTLSKDLNMSVGSVHHIIHKELKFRKVCEKWVPRRLPRQKKCDEKLGECVEK